MHPASLHSNSCSPVYLPYFHIAALPRSLCSSMKPVLKWRISLTSSTTSLRLQSTYYSEKFWLVLYAGVPDMYAATSPVVAELAESFLRVSDRGPTIPKTPQTAQESYV